jgi:ParB family chromosome partitioning protein
VANEQLPKDIQNDVASGRLTPKAAREILKVREDSKRKEVAAVVVAESLSETETKALVGKRTGQKPSAKPKQKTPSFDTEYGRVVITVDAQATYHHVEEALKQAIEEVRLRINNRVTL